MSATEQVLIEKIRQLSPQRLAEVEDFVDFLRTRDDDQRLTQAAAKVAEASFAAVTPLTTGCNGHHDNHEPGAHAARLRRGARRRLAGRRGLIKPSVLKPVFTTIEHGLVVRIMGKLSAVDLRMLREAIAQVIG